MSEQVSESLDFCLLTATLSEVNNIEVNRTNKHSDKHSCPIVKSRVAIVMKHIHFDVGSDGFYGA